jgi:hypothetical protein
VTAETNHLFDIGLFSLPAAHAPPATPNRGGAVRGKRKATARQVSK